MQVRVTGRRNKLFFRCLAYIYQTTVSEYAGLFGCSRLKFAVPSII
jgi:hypothetical protein